MRLSEHSYNTISTVKGPLLYLDNILDARMGEIVTIHFHSSQLLEGEVLKIEGDNVLVQVFGESRGLDLKQSRVIFTDSLKQAPLSMDMLNRVFSGSFRPRDGLPMYIPECWTPISGRPINPAARGCPVEFIETGISAIDGLNTLVKGQKLPIFSCAGLPAKELVADILKQARTADIDGGDKTSQFRIVFVALGLTHHEYSYYLQTLQTMQTPFTALINLSEDPVVERLMAPRFGLTAAEFLAFEKGHDVLVVITDMTNYCDALREVATAREELPGRRGYPGYLYSDLASLYERAGRIRGRSGSVTMLPVVTMPEDDITHPIPDLTGYITEGQIVLDRDMYQKGIMPPIDVLPCLSRLMHSGIGEGRTAADHAKLANALYRHYARGRDLRRLETIVGREGLEEGDQKMLDLADEFEKQFVHQLQQRRNIAQTLERGRSLLSRYGLEV
ncbi:MAG: V-type ATP synthase subunit B [Desulfuromonadales bacterium]|nr:V-type ATP synthase subunit B [Desulfuromonadales bacterium]NIS40489.1 V-type ATP synthase subunit B [Desulfuromonadales bacterium]